MATDVVVVVTAADTDRGAAHARAVAPSARAIVLCGDDGVRLGALASELRTHASSPRSVAVFLDDAAHGATALDELVRELYARGEST